MKKIVVSIMILVVTASVVLADPAQKTIRPIQKTPVNDSGKGFFDDWRSAIQIGLMSDPDMYGRSISGMLIGIPVSIGTDCTLYGIETGIFLAGTGKVYGLQCCLVSMSKNLTGLQFSIVNIGETTNGLQLGVVNISSGNTVQLGIVNYIEGGAIPFMPIFNIKL